MYVDMMMMTTKDKENERMREGQIVHLRMSDERMRVYQRRYIQLITFAFLLSNIFDSIRLIGVLVRLCVCVFFLIERHNRHGISTATATISRRKIKQTI